MIYFLLINFIEVFIVNENVGNADEHISEVVQDNIQLKFM